MSPSAARAASMDRSEAAAVLGVSPSATATVVNDAFTDQIKRHHPDVGGTHDAASRLVDARRALLDPPLAPRTPRHGGPTGRPRVFIARETWSRRVLRLIRTTSRTIRR